MKEAFYFPHFSNARHDRRLRRVRKELGIEGYGIFFMLLEVLRDQENFKYPLEDVDLLADEFVTSEQKVRAVVCNYGLFQVDDHDNFFSLKFEEFMQPYIKMRKQRVEASKKAVEARKKKAELKQLPPTGDRPVTDRTPNEKKKNEIKRKIFKEPTVEDVSLYCSERKNNVDAERFIDYYTANGWMAGKNKMKDWKAAVRTWEKNGYNSGGNSEWR